MGNIYQVVHKQRWLLQEIRNIYYYESQAGDPSDSEWLDIVDEIRADYVSEMTGFLVDTWSFYGIDYRRVDIAGLLSFSKAPTAGEFVGTQATDSVPTQVAGLVSVKGITTKPNRARTYFGGMPETASEDSVMTVGAISALETFADLQSVLNSGGTNVLQRVAAQWNTSHTQVIATNNIAGQAAVASQIPATQRRRRIGVGI